ncbi:hypothetical protein D3C78_1530170 [compost metagenome]
MSLAYQYELTLLFLRQPLPLPAYLPVYRPPYKKQPYQCAGILAQKETFRDAVYGSHTSDDILLLCLADDEDNNRYHPVRHHDPPATSPSIRSVFQIEPR